MKAAFFHDSIFIKKDDVYYTSGTLNEKLFDFYLKYFEQITIITRYKEYTQSLEKYILNNNKVQNKKIRFNCISKYYKGIKKIKKEVQNCDILIIRCHSFVGTIAAYYALKYKKKYIVESVSCAWDCLWNHGIKGKFVAPLMYLFTKLVIKNAYAVTYVSSSFLQKRYPNNNKTLSCSDVALTQFLKSPPLEKFNNIKTRTINIANISNLDMKYKGQKYLVRAVDALIKEGYNIDLYFIGGGSGEKLKKLVKKIGVDNHVYFCGFMEHKQIFKFLETIDIYIQPSDAESHGRVIVEAMSMGCPVIGSNVGGIPELVEKKNVFKKKNFYDLKRKIENIINGNIKNDSLYSFKKAQEFREEILSDKKKEFFNKVMEELKND